MTTGERLGGSWWETLCVRERETVREKGRQCEREGDSERERETVCEIGRQ